MADKLYFDPVTCRFVTISESDPVFSTMHVVNEMTEEHIDGYCSPDYVEPIKLIELIEKHNLAVQQGFIIDEPIWFDEAELLSAIWTYNDNVEHKFRETL